MKNKSNVTSGNVPVLRGLLILVLIVAAFFVANWLIRPPAKITADAPETTFSACRAYKHIEAISKLPRPQGSPEHARVRDYLFAEMERLGYEVEIQKTTAFAYERVPTFGHVQNVIARLPGSRGEKTVLVVGHYDSQPHTPGAADNGMALGSMLEAASVFASKALENDLVFLFTDSEEIGLLGARAFVEEHPLAAKTGFVINLEARGNSGPVLAFEVSEQNGWIMRNVIRSTRQAVAGSLMYEVYKLLPNDTDFTIFKRAGHSGVNLAVIEGFTHYHSPTDRPENLNIKSLQHMGNYVIDLVGHFGNLDLSQTKADDLVYFNLAGFKVMHYPIKWNTVLFVLLVILSFTVVYLKARAGASGWWKALIGLVLFLLGLALAGGAIWLVNHLVVKAYPHYGAFYDNTFHNAPLYYLAYMMLTTAIYFLLYRLAIKRLSIAALYLPGLLVALLLAAAILWMMPTATYLLFVPLFCMLAAWVITHFFKSNSLKALVWLIAAMPVVFSLAPVVVLVFHTFGLGMVYAGGILLFLLLFFMLPLLAESMKGLGLKPALAALLLFLGFMGAAHLQSKPALQRPLQSSVMYAADQDNENAYWLSVNAHTDDWNTQFFNGASLDSIPEFYPGRTRLYLKNDAGFIRYEAAEVKILHDTLVEGNRQLSFSLCSPNKPLMIELLVPAGVSLTSMSLNGIQAEGLIERFEGSPFRMLRIIHPDGGDNIITANLGGDTAFRFHLHERIIGLPVLPTYTPMPLHIVPDSDYESSMQLVRRGFSL